MSVYELTAVIFNLWGLLEI